MNRNEYLATVVMGWVKGETFSGLQVWFATGGFWRECLLNEWNPGESWPQTGMILKAMEKDGWECSITTRAERPKCVIFLRPAQEWMYVMVEHDDLREAIATAAARVKGWEG